MFTIKGTVKLFEQYELNNLHLYYECTFERVRNER